MDHKERRFWDWLRPKIEPFFYVQRVENTASDGMPDVFYTHREDTYCGFMEIKISPKLYDGYKLKGLLRPSQQNWYRKHRTGTVCIECGKYIILVGTGDLMQYVEKRICISINDARDSDIFRVISKDKFDYGSFILQLKTRGAKHA